MSREWFWRQCASILIFAQCRLWCYANLYVSQGIPGKRVILLQIFLYQRTKSIPPRWWTTTVESNCSGVMSLKPLKIPLLQNSSAFLESSKISVSSLCRPKTIYFLLCITVLLLYVNYGLPPLIIPHYVTFVKKEPISRLF